MWNVLGSFLTQEVLIVENTQQRHAPYVPALNKAVIGGIGAVAIVSGVEWCMEMYAKWDKKAQKREVHSLGLPIKSTSRVMFSSFSGLPMGTMGQMDILHKDMWRGNSDFNKED